MVPECFGRYDFDYRCPKPHRMRIDNHQELAGLSWAGQLSENSHSRSTKGMEAGYRLQALIEVPASSKELSLRETCRYHSSTLLVFEYPPLFPLGGCRGINQ